MIDGISKVFAKQWVTTNKRVGTVGGGDGELEFYGQSGGGARSSLKKTKMERWEKNIVGRVMLVRYLYSYGDRYYIILNTI